MQAVDLCSANVAFSLHLRQRRRCGCSAGHLATSRYQRHSSVVFDGCAVSTWPWPWQTASCRCPITLLPSVELVFISSDRFDQGLSGHLLLMLLRIQAFIACRLDWCNLLLYGRDGHET